MPKIILIPPMCLPDGSESAPETGYPPGIFSLINNLGTAGASVEILVLDLNRKIWDSWHDADLIRDLYDIIVSEDPDCVGFSSNCMNMPLILALADYLKNALPDILLIIGGPGVTSIDPDFLLESGLFDSIFIHEAENTFRQFVHDLLAGKTEVQKIYQADGRVPLKSLALLSQESIQYLKDCEINVFPLETGRGCPYSCLFCSTSRYYKRTHLNFPRTHVQNAIDTLVQQTGISAIEFVHDMFMLNKDYARSVIEYMNKNHPEIKWGCSLRLDSMDSETIELFQRSNIGSLFLGIESVSSKILSFIKKGLTPEQIKHSLPAVLKTKASVIISFIYGFPIEDETDLRENLRFIEQIFLDDEFSNVIVQLHLLKPFIGSDMFDQYRDRIDFSTMNAFAETYPESIQSLIYTHREYLPSFFVFKTKYRYENYIYLEKVIGFMQTYVYKHRLLFKYLSTITEELLFNMYHWIRLNREVSAALFGNPSINEAHCLINQAIVQKWESKPEGLAIQSLIRYSEIVEALDIPLPPEPSDKIKLLNGDVFISQVNLNSIIALGAVEYHPVYYYVYREGEEIVRLVLTPAGYTIFRELVKGAISRENLIHVIARELNHEIDAAEREVDGIISYLSQKGLI